MGSRTTYAPGRSATTSVLTGVIIVAALATGCDPTTTSSGPVASSASSATACADADGTLVKLDPAASANAVRCLIDQARSAAGKRPFEGSSALDGAASTYGAVGSASYDDSVLCGEGRKLAVKDALVLFTAKQPGDISTPRDALANLSGGLDTLTGYADGTSLGVSYGPPAKQTSSVAADRFAVVVTRCAPADATTPSATVPPESTAGASSAGPTASAELSSSTTSSVVPERYPELKPVGTVFAMVTSYPPRDSARPGVLFPAQYYPDYARLVGTTFGGDGVTSVGTPDLEAPTATNKAGCPIHWYTQLEAGTDASASTPVADGELVIQVGPRPQDPSLSPLTALKTKSGATVSVSATTKTPVPLSRGNTGARYVGELVPITGTLPDGYVWANGASLTIREHVPLFSVIGECYGTSGDTSFSLPNIPATIDGRRWAIVWQGLYPTPS